MKKKMKFFKPIPRSRSLQVAARGTGLLGRAAEVLLTSLHYLNICKFSKKALKARYTLPGVVNENIEEPHVSG